MTGGGKQLAHNNDYWFEHLAPALVTLGSDLSPSECHGAITGLIATGHLHSESQVLGVLSELLGSSIAPHQLLLETLLLQIQQDLESSEFTLQPLISDHTASERLQGLAHWTQGFLLGLGLGSTQRSFTRDTQQAIDDMVEISRVSLDDPIDPADLESVVEYARMTAHLVRLDSSERTN